MTATLKETRHSIILLRRASRERKERCTDAIEVPDSMKQKGPKELFKIALARPFRFLFTEAIIVFGALYNGYLYGLSFLFNGAFSLVFGPKGHGFKVQGVGLSFLGIVVGISIGPITNLWQERYYQRRIAAMDWKNVPEARVQVRTFWSNSILFWVLLMVARHVSAAFSQQGLAKHVLFLLGLAHKVAC